MAGENEGNVANKGLKKCPKLNTINQSKKSVKNQHKMKPKGALGP